LKDIPSNGHLHSECNVIFTYIELLFCVVYGRVYIRSSLLVYGGQVCITWEVPIWSDDLLIRVLN